MSKKNGDVIPSHNSKKELLDYLFYEVGKQSSHLEVASSFTAKDGTKKWSKWVHYLDAQTNEKFLVCVNNRTILDVEIVLDVDPGEGETEIQVKERYESILKRLDDANYGYRAYTTGSRGYHIHLIFQPLRNMNKTERETIKEFFIKDYGCDLAKKTERCMIALEDTEHWKTGNKKTLLADTRAGKENKIDDIQARAKLESEQKKEINERTHKKSKFIFDETRVMRSGIFPFLQLTEDVAGFGIFLPKEREIYNNKNKYLGTEQTSSPVIITSEGEICEVPTEVEKKFKIKIGCVPDAGRYCGRWSLKSIDLFTDGLAPQVDGKALFTRMTNMYRQYLYFSADMWYKIHALWDLGTYFFMLAKYYPLYELRGIKGSAKSKIMTLSRSMTFNSTEEMTNPSESTLFRETHEYRPTKYIDEAEKLFIVLKGKVESDSRAELINSGFKFTGTVARQEKIGQNFKTIYFNTYSPTMIGSINGLYGATEDRAIIHITTKAPPDDFRNKLDPEENDPRFQQIRDDCYIFALQNWRKVKDAYLSWNKETGLSNRDFNIWHLILVLAQIVDADSYATIVEFAKNQTDIKKINGLGEESVEFKILQKAYQLLKQKGSPLFLQDIADCFINTARPIHQKTISKRLNNMGFRDFLRHFERGNGYDIDLAQFESQVETAYPMILSSFPSLCSADSHLTDDRLEVEEEVMTEDSLKKTEHDSVLAEDTDSDEDVLSNGDRIVKLITKNDKGDGLTSEELVKLGFDEKILQENLEKLSRDGQIFACKPDRWKVLS